MKKGVYRAHWLTQAEESRIRELLGEKSIIFGIDVAKEDFFGTFMDRQETAIRTIKWKSPRDMRTLIGVLSSLRVESLEVAMEPSGTYGDALAHALQEAKIGVFSVSPKRSHDAIEVYDGVASSHDAKSAAIIAKLHLDRKSKPWPTKTKKQRQMAAGVELMAMFDEHLVRTVNRLEGKLARWWPELPQILELTSATLLKTLERYGGPREVAANPQKAKKYLRSVGGHLLAEEKIEAVVNSAIQTIAPPMIREEEKALSLLAQEANRTRLEAAKRKKGIEQLVVSDSRAAPVAKVVGKSTTAVLLVKLGDAAKYSSAAAYQKAAGLNLKERSSGKHKGQLRITKRGSADARRYLFLAALRLIQQDAICRAWYLKKVVRDGGVYRLKAVVALMRKLIRALWWVGQGEPFDSGKLFDVERLTIEITGK